MIAYRMIDQVCERFNLTRKELFGSGRRTGVAIPRLLAMYLVREKTKLTLKEIGTIFQKNGQGTVWKAWRRIKDYKHDPELKKVIEPLLGKPAL